MTKAMTDTELQRARELCAALGECTTTYYLVLLLEEVERLRQQQPAEMLITALRQQFARLDCLEANENSTTAQRAEEEQAILDLCGIEQIRLLLARVTA